MNKSKDKPINQRQGIILIIGNRHLLCLLLLMLLFGTNYVIAQTKSNATKATNKGAFYTDVYPNLFKEAGYSQADIDAKVAKAYHDIFEGPNKVYFEVGDSMGYVSDVKNHDARTEGLSYGMMIAVQLDKKDVFDRVWRWSK